MTRAEAIAEALWRALRETDHASECATRNWTKGPRACDCWRRDAHAALRVKDPTP